MKVSIDTELMALTYTADGKSVEFPLYSPEAFALITELWVKGGWELKYPYLFTWLGRPVIQLADDLMAVQEVIYRCRPDVVIETGVAHGGSLVFYASLFEALGHGHVVGVDIEIRPANRAAITNHELSGRITLIEGSSIDRLVIDQVKAHVQPGDTVLVILDSKHTKDHVLGELEAYGPLVSLGSYIIATDGVMELVHDVPRGTAEWLTDNPKAAAAEFLKSHSEYVLDDPPQPLFNEAGDIQRATHWPGAYLLRVR